MSTRKLVIEGTDLKVKPHKAANRPLIHVRCKTCHEKLFSFEGEVHRILNEDVNVEYRKATRDILVDDDACLHCSEEAIRDRGFQEGLNQGWDNAYEDMRERVDSTHDIKDKIKAAEEAVGMIQSSIKFTKDILCEIEEAKDDISNRPKGDNIPF